MDIRQTPPVRYETVYQKDGNWHPGKPIYVIEVNGQLYLKTVDNGKEEDNLENLPEF